MAGLSEYLNMGGHAAFIWPAYAIVAVVLIGLLIAGRRFQRATAAELAQLQPHPRRRTATTNGDGGNEA